MIFNSQSRSLGVFCPWGYDEVVPSTQNVHCVDAKRDDENGGGGGLGLYCDLASGQSLCVLAPSFNSNSFSLVHF